MYYFFYILYNFTFLQLVVTKNNPNLLNIIIIKKNIVRLEKNLYLKPYISKTQNQHPTKIPHFQKRPNQTSTQQNSRPNQNTTTRTAFHPFPSIPKILVHVYIRSVAFSHAFVWWNIVSGRGVCARSRPHIWLRTYGNERSHKGARARSLRHAAPRPQKQP